MLFLIFAIYKSGNENICLLLSFFRSCSPIFDLQAMKTTHCFTTLSENGEYIAKVKEPELINNVTFFPIDKPVRTPVVFGFFMSSFRVLCSQCCQCVLLRIISMNLLFMYVLRPLWLTLPKKVRFIFLLKVV